MPRLLLLCEGLQHSKKKKKKNGWMNEGYDLNDYYPEFGLTMNEKPKNEQENECFELF